MIAYDFIQTPKELLACCDELAKQDIVAVDLECENNIHHYGTFICLIQLSTKDKHYLVDTLALDNIDPLKTIFEDSSILKIFHDINFDIRILHHEFDCVVSNFFDTQLAAQLLGVHQPSLGSLLEEYYGVEKQSKFQKADWTTRPLPKRMLEYALGDTTHLIRLYEELKRQLQEKNRFSWLEEELVYVESLKLNYKEYAYEDFKGYGTFNRQQKAILKNLFSLREDLASKKGVPPHYIMNNGIMTKVVLNPPTSIGAWRKLTGVHPALKQHARTFYDATQQFDVSQIAVSKRSKRFNEEQKARMVALTDKVTAKAKEIGIARHLLMNKEQIRSIVLEDSYDCLRNWQREVLFGN